MKLETLSDVSSFRLNCNTLSSDKKNTEVNQLSIEIDQHLISTNSISPESNIKVRVESKGNDHEARELLIIGQIVVVNTIGNVKRNNISNSKQIGYWV